LPFKNFKILTEVIQPIRDFGFFIDSKPSDIVYIRLRNAVDSDQFILDIYRNNGTLVTPSDEVILFQFDLVNYNDCGFIQFQISFNGDFFVNPKITWDSISPLIANLFKSIYHKHKFHKPEEFQVSDSIPISQSAINIDHCCNEIDFYFSHLIAMLKQYRDFIHDRIEERFTFDFRYSIFLNPFKNYKISFFKQNIDQVMGILPYTKSISHFASGNLTKRINEFNHDIEICRDHLSDIIDSRRSSISLFLGYLGLILGLLSIAITIYYSQFYSKP